MSGIDEPLDATAPRYSSLPRKVVLKKKQSLGLPNPKLVQVLRIPKSQIITHSEQESAVVKQELRESDHSNHNLHKVDHSNHNLHMVLGNQGLALSPELQRRQPFEQCTTQPDLEQRLPPKQFIIRDNIRGMIRSNIRSSKRSSIEPSEDQNFSGKVSEFRQQNTRNITPSDFRPGRFGSVVQIGTESSAQSNYLRVTLPADDSIVFDNQFSPSQSPTQGKKIKKTKQDKYQESNFQIIPQSESNGLNSQQFRRNISGQNKQFESFATMAQTDANSSFHFNATKPQPLARKVTLIRAVEEKQGQAQKPQNQSYLNMTIGSSSFKSSGLNPFSSQQDFPRNTKSRGRTVTQTQTQQSSQTPINIQNNYNREANTISPIKGNGIGQQSHTNTNFEGASSYVMTKFKESIDGNSGLNLTQQQSSVESWRQLYNPTKNTINLAKLSMALNYQTPMKNVDMLVEYHRKRSNAQFEESTLADILNQTLQKLKRRSSKMTGRLVPIVDRTTIASGDLNPLPKMQLKQSLQEVNLDEMTQEDKFYLIQQIESTMQKNIRYNQKNTVVFQDFSDEENEGDHQVASSEPLSPNKSSNPSVFANYNVKRADSLEVIEDCAEDLEDEPYLHNAIQQPIPSKQTLVLKKPFQRRLKQPVNEGQRQILTKADLARYLRPQDNLESRKVLKIAGDCNDPDSVQCSLDSFLGQNIMMDCNHEQSPQSAVRNTLFQHEAKPSE